MNRVFAAIVGVCLLALASGTVWADSLAVKVGSKSLYAAPSGATNGYFDVWIDEVSSDPLPSGAAIDDFYLRLNLDQVGTGLSFKTPIVASSGMLAGVNGIMDLGSDEGLVWAVPADFGLNAPFVSGAKLVRVPFTIDAGITTGTWTVSLDLDPFDPSFVVNPLGDSYNLVAYDNGQVIDGLTWGQITVDVMPVPTPAVLAGCIPLLGMVGFMYFRRRSRQ